MVFCLDPSLRITYCNPAWDRFAAENGAQQLCRQAVTGQCILDYISGPDRDYFENQYRRVLQQTEPWERDYECSSKDLYRKFRLRVIPMRTVQGLFVINSLHVERAHKIAVSHLIEEAYRTPDGLIVMCSNCRRTRRNLPGAAIWDWVPSFVERFPELTSHGICAQCVQLYYLADL